MNIAFLIGVSSYDSENGLPACEFDVREFQKLLVSTRKYDDIRAVTTDTKAEALKNQLRSFFQKYQGSDEVEEALIYFSGHGIFTNDALFCCSDFDPKRPASTSLSNSELDDLLRSVSPKVAVKVIDSCQSGAAYIKDVTAGFEKALGESRLNSFICMCSSRQTQSSYANAQESAFTARWIEAALSKQDGQVFYRDIQSSLADAFASNSEQTPFFVTQGSGLEIFSSMNDEMRALALARRAPSKATSHSMLEMIHAEVSKRDKQFVSHSDALAAIDRSRKSLESLQVADDLIQQFYSVTIDSGLRLAALPRLQIVAKLADSQAWKKKYFIRIATEKYLAKVPKNFLSAYSTLSALSMSKNEDFIEEVRYRPTTIEATEDLPMEVAEVSFEPKHPSLQGFKLYLGLVHSLTEVTVVSTVIRLTQRGWQERAPELSDVKWGYETMPWSSVIDEPNVVWRGAVTRAEAELRSYLESLTSTTDGSSSEESAS